MEAAALDADPSSADDMPSNPRSPRTVRSRFVATKSCSAPDNLDQSVGSTIGARPSTPRALSMAWRAAAWQAADVSKVAEQTLKKSGVGGRFEDGLPVPDWVSSESVWSRVGSEVLVTIVTPLLERDPEAASNRFAMGETTMSARAARGTVNAVAMLNPDRRVCRRVTSESGVWRGVSGVLTKCLHRA